MPDATFACPDLTTFCRRVLRTGSDLLTDRQRQRLTACSPPSSTSKSRPPGASTAHRRRLPQPRPSRSEDRTKKDHRDDHRGRAHGAHRADHARPNAKTSRCRRAGLLRSSRHQQRAPPRRSTAASSTYAALLWAFVTSPTTSHGRYWKPAASSHNYTVNPDEPDKYVIDHPGRPAGRTGAGDLRP